MAWMHLVLRQNQAAVIQTVDLLGRVTPHITTHRLLTYKDRLNSAIYRRSEIKHIRLCGASTPISKIASETLRRRYLLAVFPLPACTFSVLSIRGGILHERPVVLVECDLDPGANGFGFPLTIKATQKDRRTNRVTRDFCGIFRGQDDSVRLVIEAHSGVAPPAIASMLKAPISVPLDEKLVVGFPSPPIMP